jgi:hypothetical protein
VACVEPSDRLIVPSLPVTPAPAVTGPLTGGQIDAHDPLHLDVVGVSGANQYSVKPLALVTTMTPPIFAAFTAVPDELVAGAELVAGEEAALEEELPDPAVLAGDELPHAAAIRAAAASPASAHHRLRITYPRSRKVDRHIPRDLVVTGLLVRDAQDSTPAMQAALARRRPRQAPGRCQEVGYPPGRRGKP